MIDDEDHGFTFYGLMFYLNDFLMGGALIQACFGLGNPTACSEAYIAWLKMER
jgi:hypothetical protein